jgi:RNA polymerase sigma-70 factor (ECF subfamily)
LPVDELVLGASGGAPELADDVVDRLTIDDALAALPDEFRVAVVLRDVCALDYAEIAEVLGIPPGTVRSRIARGRAAVAAHITGNPDPPSDRQIPRP